MRQDSVVNYRPICIISCIPKLFESTIREDTTAMMRRKIIKEQFGFMAKSSTKPNLLLYSGFLSWALEGGYTVCTLTFPWLLT